MGSAVRRFNRAVGKGADFIGRQIDSTAEVVFNINKSFKRADKNIKNEIKRLDSPGIRKSLGLGKHGQRPGKTPGVGEFQPSQAISFPTSSTSTTSTTRSTAALSQRAAVTSTGRRSTILTSGSGLTGTPTATTRKTLLGR